MLEREKYQLKEHPIKDYQLKFPDKGSSLTLWSVQHEAYQKWPPIYILNLSNQIDSNYWFPL